MANSNQNITTPDNFFQAVQNYYGLKFEFDMAADESNAKCQFYFTEQDDSLEIDWPTSGPLWINPPFRKAGKYAAKCLEQKERGCHIVTVWPLSGDRNQAITWLNSEVTVIHGRVWPEVRGVMLCEWKPGKQFLYRGNCNARPADWDREKGIIYNNYSRSI